MTSFSEPIASALFWDVPRLIHLGEGQFARVFQQHRWPDDTEVDSSTVLGRASIAVHEGLFGDEDKCRLMAHELAASEDLGHRLIGHAIAAWPYTYTDTDALERYVQLVESLDNGSNKARLAMKAAAFAFDAKHDELMRQALQVARTSAPPSTLLQHVAEITSFNLLGGDFPPTQTFAVRDPLVDLDWIDEASLDSAREALDKLVSDRRRNAWSETISFGGPPPLHRIIAAELAATWAGALWMRAGIRKQLASEIIVRRQSGRDWAVYAAKSWVGAREDLSKIEPMIEPYFDSDSADEIWASIPLAYNNMGLPDNRRSDAASVLWDEFSIEQCLKFLEEVDPPVGDHPTFREFRQAWAVMALRVPDVWAERFVRLAEPQQLALLDVITSWTAENLPRTAAARLYELVRVESTDLSGLGHDWALAVAGICSSAASAFPEHLLGELRPSTVIELFEEQPNLLPREMLSAAMSQMVDAVRSHNEEGRKGTIQGFGGRDPRWMLGVGFTLEPEFKEALQLLIDSAMDAEIPSDYRVQSLAALRLVAFRDLLSTDAARQLRDAPEAGVTGFMFSERTSLFAAYKLGIAAWFDGASAHHADLFSLSRHSDAATRALVLESIIFLAPKEGPDQLLATVAISALFDPSWDVVRQAVRAVERLPLADDDAMHEVISERFALMLESAPKRVRSQVAITSRQLEARTGRGDFRRLVQQSADDQSWQVRHEATRPLSDLSGDA